MHFTSLRYQTAILTLGLLSVFQPASAIELSLYDTWYGGMGSVTRIACDTVNHTVLATVPQTGELLTIDSNGSILTNVTSMERPAAVAALGNACLVADGRAVKKVAMDGSIEFVLGQSDTFFVGPHDVAASASGHIFVADADDIIKVFDATGNYLSQFGGHGRFNGQMHVPVALAVNDARGELIVSDQNNYRVQVFSFDGDSIAQWGVIGNGNYAPAEFLRPWGLDVDALGRIWVWDALLDAVQVFSPQGDFLFMCRLSVPDFRGALDLAIDGDRLYLSAPATECIYVFQITESTPLTPPESFELTAYPAPTGIRLRWRAVGGALEYHLFRSGSSNFESGNTEDLGAMTDTTYTDVTSLGLYDRRFYRLDAIFPPGVCNEPDHALGIDVMGDGPVLEWHDDPHNVAYGINCRSCHATHFPYPFPPPDWYFGDHLCKTCHVESGMAAAQENHFTSGGTMYCNTCHSPHFQQDQFDHYYIRTAVLTPNSSWRAVTYNHATDFVHGAPSYDGICEVCHTQTDYHRNDSSGDHSHHVGENCGACHAHRDGFAVPSN